MITLSHKTESGLAGLALSLLMIVSAGCERDMQIKIDGKNPPTFSLSGSGNLVFLYLSEVPDKKRLSPEDPEIWKIRPSGVDKVAELPSITYGTVPTGFTQVTPVSGNPPSLIEGKVYAFGGPNYNANGGSIWFIIKDGKSVKIAKPDGGP